MSLPRFRATPVRREAAIAGRWLVPVVLAVVYLASVSTSNPPGFYRDESNIAFNAATISESGRDEHGALLPLYFRSFGDWKSAPYIYLLAGVFRITGPNELAARALSAVLGLAAVAVIGLLAIRLSGSRSVGVATAALAAVTPWLFEVTRLVFEVALEPLLLALFLFTLAGVRDARTWPRRNCLALGGLLGLIAYAYAAGRALAPLLALLLVVFVTRERWRSLLWTWAAFGAALVPMAVFELHHPGSLLVRYHHVSAAPGDGIVGTVTTIAANAVRGLNLWRWSTSGDPNPRHHVAGTGSLLLVGCVLAIAGVVLLIRHERWSAFWSFVSLGALASVAPAAIADIPMHSLRSIGLPVFLITLAIPAIARLRDLLPRRAWCLAAAAIVAAGALQFSSFALHYWHDGPQRSDAFETAFPRVLRAAAAAGSPIVVYRRDPEALGNALWYGTLWGIPIHVVEPGQPTPRGAAAVAYDKRCPSCHTIVSAGIFTAYITH